MLQIVLMRCRFTCCVIFEDFKADCHDARRIEDVVYRRRINKDSWWERGIDGVVRGGRGKWGDQKEDGENEVGGGGVVGVREMSIAMS